LAINDSWYSKKAKAAVIDLWNTWDRNDALYPEENLD
jgi:hypothetical protein